MSTTSVDDDEDLQTYLDSFNKEIEEDSASLVALTSGSVGTLAGSDDMTQTLLEAENCEAVDNNDEGTYFVDQDGNYYFQVAKKATKISEKSKPIADSRVTRGSRSSKTVTFNAKSSDGTQESVVTKSEPIVVNEADDEFVVVLDSEIIQMQAANCDDPDDPKPVNEIYEFNEQAEELVETHAVDKKSTLVASKIVQLKPHDRVTEPKVVHCCAHCEYSTNKRYLLSRHLKAHADDRPFKCSVCERGYKSNTSLVNHVNTHLGKKPHACKSCDSCFTTSGELMRHVRYRHTLEKPHKCPECDYSSVELSKLRRHMRCHTGERPYQCPHCTYASPDTFKLKRHLRTHTGEKPYECEICHARFTQSNSLKSHRLIHSVGDKPIFQCSLCPTTCGRKTDLRMHVQKLHHSDHPIKCKRCGKELPDRYSYKVHVKSHNGEKCYRCDICPYASVSLRHLETHMLIHTDEKPYACEICEMAFRQQKLLTRHINLHHNQYYVPPEPREKKHSCPHCERSFTNKGNLLRHMAHHDPDSKLETVKMKLKIGRLTRVKPIGGNPKAASKASELPEQVGSIHAGALSQTEVDCGVADMTVGDEEMFENDSGEVDSIDAYYELIETFDEEVDEKPEIKNLLINSKKQASAPLIKNVSIKKESNGKEIMAVEVGDDDRYMVVQVIQCEDEDDEEDQGAQVEEELTEFEEEVNEPYFGAARTKNKSNRAMARTKWPTGRNRKVIDLANCFGFETEEGADGDIDSEYAGDGGTKETIHMIDVIDED